MPPPNYFPKNVLMNINGYDSIDEVIDRGTKALSVAAFKAIAEQKSALILENQKSRRICKSIYSKLHKHWHQRKFCSLGWHINS